MIVSVLSEASNVESSLLTWDVDDSTGWVVGEGAGG
jgi:hypothetical protein